MLDADDSDEDDLDLAAHAHLQHATRRRYTYRNPYRRSIYNQFRFDRDGGSEWKVAADD